MDALTKVGRAAVKVCSFLLVKLGLWIPLVFTVLFFVVLAITGTPISDLIGIYLFGLVTTFVLAAVFVAMMFFRKLDKRAAAKAARSGGAVGTEKEKVRLVRGAQSDAPVSTFAPESAPRDIENARPADPGTDYGNGYDRGFDRGYDRGYNDGRYASGDRNAAASYGRGDRDGDRADAPRGFDRGGYDRSERSEDKPAGDSGFIPYNTSSSAPERESERSSEFIPYHTETEREPEKKEDGYRFLPYDRPLEEQPRNRDFTAAPAPVPPLTRAADEQPHIFRTRMDPDLLIYEYSDRLDFYRKEPAGLLLVSSEPKSSRRR